MNDLSSFQASSTAISSFLHLPCEIRLQIYTFLLSPSIPLHPYQRQTTRFSASTTLLLPLLNLQPAILSTSRQIKAEALPILYSSQTFCAHSSLLVSMPYLLQPSRPIIMPSLASLIKKWYLNVRLDTDARFTRSQVTAAFTGCEELEVEVWQAEYGTSNLNTLRMFEGVRGVRRAKIVGNVGEEYRVWLENCMSAAEGEYVEGFRGNVEIGLWGSGNR